MNSILNFSVCRANDSSILFTRARTALLSPIQWNYDAKLLKKQLLDEFWWYLITDADRCNCTLLFFCIANRYSKYLIYFCIITPKFWLIQFLIEIWFTCPEIFFQPHMIKIKSTSWYCWLSLEVIFLGPFSYYSMTPFGGS